MAQTTIRCVEFHAQVDKVATRKDRTVTVTLNLPEYCVQQAMQMGMWQNDEVRVVVEWIVGEDSGEKSE